MFIHMSDLIIFLVLISLGAIGFRMHYKQEIRQWYSMYSDVNDKYKKAVEELSEYKKKEIIKEY